MLRVLAAGSLRGVWGELMARFQAQGGEPVECHFGPAGLLRLRIEQGEACDLFASANIEHALALVQRRQALRVTTFTRNSLCLTALAARLPPASDWLAALRDDSLRLATSTPGCDPSGDYTWQLFERIEARHPGLGAALQRRARPLVGGVNSAPVPPGDTAAGWLLGSGQAELFIGYSSYAPRLRASTQMRVFSIPEPYCIRANYALALRSPQAFPLMAFLVSPGAQRIFSRNGFGE